MYNELDRGKAFGALYLTGALGAMLGTLYATNLGAFYHLFRAIRVRGKQSVQLGGYVTICLRTQLLACRLPLESHILYPKYFQPNC